MAQITTSTFLSESILFLRDRIRVGVTDPISAKRASNESFVLSSYPHKRVKYPIITVRNDGPADIQRTGMRSELRWVRLTFEIRIWATNEAQRDQLTEQTLNFLRTNQFGGTNTSADDRELHDYTLLSVVPVDELGQEGPKSSVMTVSYSFFQGS